MTIDNGGAMAFGIVLLVLFGLLMLILLFAALLIRVAIRTLRRWAALNLGKRSLRKKCNEQLTPFEREYPW